MIEVQASLAHGGVYLAGESVECIVTFRNPSPSGKSETDRITAENLAWSSAQIHCQCSVSETKAKFPVSASVSEEEIATASKDTSFIPCQGEKGHVVFSTKPKILFCDLRLMPGESKTFLYKETVPADIPPSYRGQAVKYAYKLTVGTQRVNAAIKLLRIPLRILVLQGLPEITIPNDSEEFHVAPSNPFLESQQKDSPLDIALQLLENATARRRPSFYNVTNQNGRVVRFCLLKNAYRVGEDIIGTFDFSQATVPCVQFSVTLQCEEELREECRKQLKQGPSVTSYSKYHEFCLHICHTHMSLPIPLTVTPAFTTNIMSLQWKLHFEFVTTTKPLPEAVQPKSSSDNVTWQGPEMLDIQTMVWDLPISVHASHPLHVAYGQHTLIQSSLLI